MDANEAVLTVALFPALIEDSKGKRKAWAKRELKRARKILDSQTGPVRVSP